MPSTPLIASSSGVATVSAMTFGLAPGYWARTTIEGGTTSGYSEMGRILSAIKPARKMRSDSTPAKIGRSMKNLERFISIPGDWGPAFAGVTTSGPGLRRSDGLRRGGHLHLLRQHEGAGTDALQAVHHDLLA